MAIASNVPGEVLREERMDAATSTWLVALTDARPTCQLFPKMGLYKDPILDEYVNLLCLKYPISQCLLFFMMVVRFKMHELTACVVVSASTTYEVDEAHDCMWLIMPYPEYLYRSIYVYIYHVLHMMIYCTNTNASMMNIVC